MHSEITSLLGGVWVIRPGDAEECCKSSGILHTDRVVFGGVASGRGFDLLDAIGVVDGFEPDNSLRWGAT
jgi:hypothetical protein